MAPYRSGANFKRSNMMNLLNEQEMATIEGGKPSCFVASLLLGGSGVATILAAIGTGGIGGVLLSSTLTAGAFGTWLDSCGYYEKYGR